MYYDDLSNYSYYLNSSIDSVFNVGWLDKQHGFSKGDVEKDFLEKLARIFLSDGETSAHVNKIRGAHECSLSDCNDLILTYNGESLGLGSSEVWLPSVEEGQHFASPSMIYHYIDVHGYLPPSSFIDAVMSFELDKPFNAQEVYLEKIKGHF